MTVEDRIRAATRARAGLVREIRPLEIPERLPRRGLRVPRARFLAGWLVPAAAAVVVVALAVALVSVHQSRNGRGIPGFAPAPPASGATIPRYYVLVSPRIPAVSVAARVADSRTGAVLARVRPPAHRMFAGVTGAADDRTFVLDTVPVSGMNGRGTHVWYLLRIATGTGHPASLTRLPVAGPPVSAQVQGLALSPDGRTLAVMFQPGMPDTGPSGAVRASGDAPAAPVVLRTYSLATGRALRTWTTPAPKGSAAYFPNPDNVIALSWTGSHTLAFRYPLGRWPDYVRMLNTASKGSDFVKSSKPVVADPGGRRNCASLLAVTDGRTVVCGTLGNATGGCVKEEPEFDLWSTATGKLTRVLYRYKGTCSAAEATVLWAGPGGTVIGAISAYTYIKKKRTRTRITIGLISHGRFAPLRISIPASAFFPGVIAF